MLVSFIFAIDDDSPHDKDLVRSAIYSRLLAYDDIPVTMVLGEDTLVHSDLDHPGVSFHDYVETLCGESLNYDFTIEPSQFRRWIRNHRLYMLVIQAVPQEFARRLHTDLHQEMDPAADRYLGCLAIDQANRFQYQLFIHDTSMVASYRQGRLLIYENGRLRDATIMQQLEAEQFDELEFDDLGPPDNGDLFDWE